MTSAVRPIDTEALVNQSTAGLQNDPAIVALADGGYALCWTDAGAAGGDLSGTAVRLRIYDAAGTPRADEILVNTTTTGAQGAPTIGALANGGLVVAWEDASTLADPDGLGIRAQVFDASGAKVGAELLVNTVTRLNQNAPTITGLAGGGFVIGWTDASGLSPDRSGTGIRAQLFADTGARLGSEFLVNSTTAGSQIAPALAGLASGGFVAVWTDRSGIGGDPTAPAIKAQLLSASGAKIGGEMLVNTVTAGAQDMPVVTALDGGGFAVAWRDASEMDDPSGSGIKAQVFSATGAKIGGEILVNTFTLNAQTMPAIAAVRGGGFVVSWQDPSTLADDDSGAAIRAQVFDAAGARVGREFAMNGIVAGQQTAPVVAGLADGSIVAAWSDASGNADDPSGGVRARVFAADSGAIADVAMTVHGIDSGAIQNSVGAWLRPQGAINADYSYTLLSDSTGGGFALDGARLMIADNGLIDLTIGGAQVLIRIADGFGNSIDRLFDLPVGAATGGVRHAAGPEIRLNSVTAGNQQQVALAALVGGGTAAVWADASGIDDASSYGIKLRLLDAGGAPLGAETIVNLTTAGSQDDPAVAALAGGGFVVAWSDASGTADPSSSGIRARLFAADGTPAGGELLVNTQTANAQAQPSVSALADGGFVVVWRDDSLLGGDASASSIKAQRFGATGVAIGAETLVNTETANRQDTPAVAALATGGWVVAWSDSSAIGGDPSKNAIKAQVFDGGGGRIGGEFLVNVATAGNQQQPVIAALDGGGFAIAWADGSRVGGDASNFAIKLRLFDDAGTARSDEILGNTSTPGAQLAPALAAMPGGGFLLSWSDYGGTGVEQATTGVKAQVFAADGSTVGPEFVVPAQTLGLQANPAVAADGAGGFVIGWTDQSGQSGDLTGTAIALRHFAPQPASAILATPDHVATIEDLALRLAPALLLANDVDSLGLALTLGAVGNAVGGTVALAANGDVIFTPLADFAGTASFDYTVGDSAGTTATGTVTVTVTAVPDAPRGALFAQGGAVDENAAAATVVGTVAAIDPDAGDTFTYALIDDAGHRFAIDALTGIVTVEAGAALDYEAAASHQIVVRVTDAGDASVDVALAVAVNDLPEPRSFVGTNGGNVFTAATNDFWTIDGLGGNDILTGNASPDVLRGGAGTDALDGAAGADSMAGGTGNDSYVVDDPGDLVIEAFGEGSDLVSASIDYALPAHVENLTLTGLGTIAGTGNDLTNTIRGNDAANVLTGLEGGDLLVGNGGDDLLVGGPGGDFLQGGEGADTIVGGAGADELTGGTGADRFVFDTLGPSAERDKIRDFAPGEDRLVIDPAVFAAFAGLSDIPAAAFVNGVQALTADQHLIYQKATGNLWYDPDGAGGVDQIQIALFSTRPILTAADFVTG